MPRLASPEMYSHYIPGSVLTLASPEMHSHYIPGSVLTLASPETLSHDLPGSVLTLASLEILSRDIPGNVPAKYYPTRSSLSISFLHKLFLLLLDYNSSDRILKIFFSAP